MNSKIPSPQAEGRRLFLLPLQACGGLPSEVASSEHLCNARAFFQRQLETKESREQTLKGDTEGVFISQKFWVWPL